MLTCQERLKSGNLYCAVCGWTPIPIYFEIMHAHHFVPTAAGGKSEPSNYLLLCPICHAYTHALRAMRGGEIVAGPKTKTELIEEIRDCRSQEAAMPQMEHISIWIPLSMVHRADALLDDFAQSTDAPMGAVTRSDVLRAALVRGLAALERQLPETTQLPGQ